MSRLEKSLWISQRLMGLVFLVAGLTKIWDPVLFFWEALPHAQILVGHKVEVLVASFAPLLGPIECLVGLALLIDWKPRLVLPMGVAMMAFFIFITAMSWHRGAGESCGCFGNLVNRSPGEAMVENVLMLGLLVFSWWGLRRRSVVFRTWRRWAIVAGGLAFLTVLGVRYVSERDRMTESDLEVGFQFADVPLLDSDIDLTRGAYLVELFSPTCSHCQQAVPKVNAWAADPNVPRVIALSRYAQDDPRMVQFKQQYQPRFEIVTISHVDFMRLVWRHGVPRLAYVEDGVVKRVWKGSGVPSLAELKGLNKSP